MTGRWQAPFPLFVAGALLFAIVAAICIRLAGGDDSLTVLELSVPLFGLPFTLASPKWRPALYFVLLVPAVHYLAVTAAIESVNWQSSGFLPGAIGGVTGSVLSFAALPMIAPKAYRKAAIMALGVVVLALLGGFGVRQMDSFSGTALDPYGLLLTLYLPWQLAFGFFLSLLLADPREKRLADAPAPE